MGAAWCHVLRRCRAAILPIVAAVVVLVATVSAPASPGAAPLPVSRAADPLPPTLAATGLYAGASATAVRPDAIAFAPQYALWSNGTRKQRWIWLPPGSAIDASDPDAWQFPVGTRLWKEFGYGRPVETRYLERLADGSWRFAVYVWDDAGRGATLAPAIGVPALPVADAAGGRYRIPSRGDCVACHEGSAVPVLGFTALQLSADRDPRALHAPPPGMRGADLATLVREGRVIGLPQALIASPPRIPAADAVERTALGYLHANCGHCHNRNGALPGLELALAQEAAAPHASREATLASLLGHASRFGTSGDAVARRVVAGDADASVLTARMRTNNRLARMPPVGVDVVDEQGIALIGRWIAGARSPTPEKQP